MAEGVVDELELVEVEAEQGGARAGAGLLGDHFREAGREQRPVRQARQRIVVGHVGDARLGAALLGDVDGRAEHRRPALEGKAALEQRHFDQRAVGPTMMVQAAVAGESARSGLRQVRQAPGQEGFAAVAIMGDRRLVHGDETGRILIDQPHRQRIALEQEAKRGLARLDVPDIGHGDGDEIADGLRLHLQVQRRPVGARHGEFERRPIGASQDARQPLRHTEPRRDEIAQPLPLQARDRPPENLCGALIEGDDLEVRDRTRCLADRAERHQALARRAEHRLHQLGAHALTIDVDEEERRSAAVGERDADEIPSGDDTIGDAVASGPGGLAGAQGGDPDLLDRPADLVGHLHERPVADLVVEPVAKSRTTPEDALGPALAGGDQGAAVGQAAEPAQDDGIVSRHRSGTGPATAPVLDQRGGVRV